MVERKVELDLEQETNKVEEAIKEAKDNASFQDNVSSEMRNDEVEVMEAEVVDEEVEASDDQSSEVEEGNDKNKKEKKLGKFKKKKVDPRDEKIEELTDRVTRQMAEFDNFRKRTDKEKTAMYEVGAKSVIEKLLPIVDNFERGFQTVTEEEKSNPFVDGMDKVYKQVLTMLEDIEVKPIEAVGCEFNPELHNAVMHIEDENFGENTISEEFQKGYTYRDQVVRYSMVKVAN